ncbi:MAG: primosomal protein N' [Flavobacteriia bacterium]|jgi:primosomal protein N' (replication factor Y)
MAERTTLFVDIILPIPIHREFTYRVPHDLNDLVIVGARVIVPFGKSKLLTGIITRITEEAPKEYQAKYIEHILDESPIITGNQYKLWKWIASYYMAPIGDVMNAALPANFKLASETRIVLHPDFDGKIDHLDERESRITETLEIRESIDLKELSEILGIKTVQPIIKRMMDRRIILSVEELTDKFVPKTAVYVELGPLATTEDDLNTCISGLESKKNTEKQLQAFLSILREGNYQNGHLRPIERKKLLDMDVSASSLNTLEKNGMICQTRYEISRFKENTKDQSSFKEMSPAQFKALTDIQVSFEEHNTTLLHGVTGSGKTEIYVQLIQEQLDNGKQVLFLLPEIALTTQLIQRLSAYFGDQIGVYHSRFNQNERVEIWNHVLTNNPDRFRIILGARSSIFLPFRDLGLIIVDEEHEPSFKQYDPSPRYNARDAAIVLSHFFGAKVLLGSATPAMETYFNAKTGKYGLVELTERYGGLKLPEVFCADVKKERRQKSMNTHFTTFLIDHIREALNKKEQVILFQNRRGYTPLWSCEICNWTPKCKNCDVSLTYHKHSNTLKCHYCSYTTPPIGSCACCGSNRLKMIGFGTEKVEDELSLIFPNHSIKRLDLDTTRSKNSYETILTDFENRNIDILIGTQMVSKGLDFDNVSLVGVLDADMLLNRPDFRAFERSFQLMSQVAGRSGRKGKRGQVIIQTGDPDHWVIRKVIEHDYVGFYDSEVLERKNFFYPPFYKIIEFTLKHKDEHLLDKASMQFAQSLREVFKERVIGPEFPIVRRIQNLYLKSIKLKVERDISDKKIKERLQMLVDAFYSVPLNKSIRMVVDVDPA